MTDGIDRRRFDGGEALATRGPPVYGEPTSDGWRRWSVGRSKLANMIDRGMPIELASADRVLYLGAASGTTVSHVADVVDRVYAVEFAAGPIRSLLDVAADRPNVIPLLKDARRPAHYGHVVEANLDVIGQDVATRDQAAVATANARYLAPDGTLVIAVKARSEDVAADPADVFASVRERLSDAFEILATDRLDPHHRDHLGIVARPRDRTALVDGG